MVDKHSATATTDVDHDGPHAAELLQTQLILDTLVGKTVASAQVEETRVAVSTTDGLTFFFYGFMSGRMPADDTRSRD